MKPTLLNMLKLKLPLLPTATATLAAALLALPVLPACASSTPPASDPPPAAVSDTGDAPAYGDKSSADAPARFKGFCDSWMSKLRQREVRNATNSKIKRVGSDFVGRFVGYGRKPVRCIAKPTGKRSSPYVGRLIYHEIEYEKAGPTQKGAATAKPREVKRVEVMELFRFNGEKWIY